MSARGALLALAALLGTGCPGLLGDPAPYVAARLDATAPVTPKCPVALSVTADLFAPRCATAGCHDPIARAAGLDLRSPGVAGRVIGGRSTRCAGLPLADPFDPDGSLLLLKLFAEPPCGDRMPLRAPALSAAEVECVRAWITARGQLPEASVATDASDDGAR